MTRAGSRSPPSTAARTPRALARRRRTESKRLSPWAAAMANVTVVEESGASRNGPVPKDDRRIWGYDVPSPSVFTMLQNAPVTGSPGNVNVVRLSL